MKLRRPVEALARLQRRLSARDAQLNAIAVEFDLVAPVAARRRPVPRFAKLGRDEIRKVGGGRCCKLLARVALCALFLRMTGQIADCAYADALTDELGEGDILLADKSYDSNAIRAKAAERKAWANIPPKTNRKRSFVFSPWVYRQRNLVERLFNRIKQFRGIATRYDKRPENYLAAVKLVAARIWCKNL